MRIRFNSDEAGLINELKLDGWVRMIARRIFAKISHQLVTHD